MGSVLKVTLTEFVSTLQPIGMPVAVGWCTESTLPMPKTACDASMQLPMSLRASKSASHAALVWLRQ